MSLQKILPPRLGRASAASAIFSAPSSKAKVSRWLSSATSYTSSAHEAHHKSRRLGQSFSLRPASRMTNLLSLQRREYHSYDHPPAPGRFSDAEQAILSAAYAHVPSHGFSQQALALGARDAGYPDISTSILPDGVFSLIRWHLTAQREALAPRSREIFDGVGGAAPADIRDRVQRLTWERLMGNRGIIDRWQEALAVMGQPTYIPVAIKELSLLADEIWFLAGDTSVDSSWYTKRASLSAIYAASELFMTNDKSLDFIETRDFLHRRLNEADGLGTYVRSLGQWVGYTASAGINVLRSKRVRL